MNLLLTRVRVHQSQFYYYFRFDEHFSVFIFWKSAQIIFPIFTFNREETGEKAVELPPPANTLA